MRTLGWLDVDQNSKAVTSFVCTNTVVAEQEGKQLIKLMKKKFTLMINNNEAPKEEEELSEVSFAANLYIISYAKDASASFAYVAANQLLRHSVLPLIGRVM